MSDPVHVLKLDAPMCDFCSDKPVVAAWNASSPVAALVSAAGQSYETRSLDLVWAACRRCDGLLQRKVTPAQLALSVLRRQGALAGLDDSRRAFLKQSLTAWFESVLQVLTTRADHSGAFDESKVVARAGGTDQKFAEDMISDLAESAMHGPRGATEALKARIEQEKAK